MRILVTNDDGIDSIGLHVLARSLVHLGDVVVGAPDSEYSGASAACGSMKDMKPVLHEAHIDGVAEAWTLNGPPALCVIFSRLGAFGEPFDLVVSGINPGANVGWAVNHSGTIGAAVTARAGGVTGVAVSQAVTGGAVMGQGWDEMIKDLKWETAGKVAAAAVEEIIERPPAEAGVLNINVPNLELDELKGVRRTAVAHRPRRALSTIDIVPQEGHQGAYDLKFNFGAAPEEEPGFGLDEDVGAVAAGYVSTTWLSRAQAIEFPQGEAAIEAIDGLVG